MSLIQFEWNLSVLAPAPSAEQAPYVIRRAEAAEKEKIKTVATSALSMDSGWNDATKTLVGRVIEKVNEIFNEEEPNALVLLHGSRIIGVSVLDKDPDSENHFVTGPCVLHEYRSRGLGSQLTLHSLVRLKEIGLPHARAIAGSTSTLAKFVYPKFGPVSRPYEGAWSTTSIRLVTSR
jgi:ribosomal protein S18 acetylase RimI-like enzyme